MDVQGAEMVLLNSSSWRELLLAKAHRLIIGTHSHKIHQLVRALLLADGWMLIWEHMPTRDPTCVENLFRGKLNPNRTTFDWPAVLQHPKCTQHSCHKQMQCCNSHTLKCHPRHHSSNQSPAWCRLCSAKEQSHQYQPEPPSSTSPQSHH